jgi:hypothetical protein
MIHILLTIIISFFVTTLFGHIMHWSLHQRWVRKFTKSHMTHHLILYPPKSYLSDKYKYAGKDSTLRFFVFASLPMILAPIILGALGILGWHLVITVLATELLIGFLHNYLHDSFHIKNHWIYRVPLLRDIFGVWVKLHYLHHVDMGKNYGIFTFHWDKIFNTFKK